MHETLTQTTNTGYDLPTAPHWAVGIAVLNYKRHSRIPCGFFVPKISVMTDWVEHSQEWPLLVTVLQLRSVCRHMIAVVWRQFFNLISGVAIMHDLTLQNKTMSSLEIAELTGKQHSHVKRDIEVVLSEAGIGASKFGGTYKSQQGKDLKCFNLPKRECDLVVSGYPWHVWGSRSEGNFFPHSKTLNIDYFLPLTKTGELESKGLQGYSCCIKASSNRRRAVLRTFQNAVRIGIRHSEFSECQKKPSEPRRCAFNQPYPCRV